MKLDLRFAIVDSSGARSSVWRIWSHKDEVYAAKRSMAHIQKFSFHSSGICRDAFTAERGVPETLSDRAMTKWRRAVTPERGKANVSAVLRVAFPTDFLSSAPDPESKPFKAITAAPSGMAVAVTIVFSHDPVAELRRTCNDLGINVLGAVALAGETAAVISQHINWETEDFWMPASHGRNHDLIFAKEDATGRPIRLFRLLQPKDGDCLFIEEIGGHKESHLPSRPFGNVFSRKAIIADNDTRFLPPTLINKTV